MVFLPISSGIFFISIYNLIKISNNFLFSTTSIISEETEDMSIAPFFQTLGKIALYAPASTHYTVPNPYLYFTILTPNFSLISFVLAYLCC
jgi:hypothetical protein